MGLLLWWHVSVRGGGGCSAWSLKLTFDLIDLFPMNDKVENGT